MRALLLLFLLVPASLASAESGWVFWMKVDATYSVHGAYAYREDCLTRIKQVARAGWPGVKAEPWTGGPRIEPFKAWPADRYPNGLFLPHVPPAWLECWPAGHDPRR